LARIRGAGAPLHALSARGHRRRGPRRVTVGVPRQARRAAEGTGSPLARIRGAGAPLRALSARGHRRRGPRRAACSVPHSHRHASVQPLGLTPQAASWSPHAGGAAPGHTARQRPRSRLAFDACERPQRIRAAAARRHLRLASSSASGDHGRRRALLPWPTSRRASPRSPKKSMPKKE
jgi:hypothetical protein